MAPSGKELPTLSGEGERVQLYLRSSYVFRITTAFSFHRKRSPSLPEGGCIRKAPAIARGGFPFIYPCG